MRTSAISALVLSASLASGVAATQRFAHVLPRELMPRQSQSFQPGTSSGQGSTCQEAFGGDSKLCADSDVCYDESIGDSCCSEGCKTSLKPVPMALHSGGMETDELVSRPVPGRLILLGERLLLPRRH